MSRCAPLRARGGCPRLAAAEKKGRASFFVDQHLAVAALAAIDLVIGGVERGRLDDDAVIGRTRRNEVPRPRIFDQNVEPQPFVAVPERHVHRERALAKVGLLAPESVVRSVDPRRRSRCQRSDVPRHVAVLAGDAFLRLGALAPFVVFAEYPHLGAIAKGNGKVVTPGAELRFAVQRRTSHLVEVVIDGVAKRPVFRALFGAKAKDRALGGHFDGGRRVTDLAAHAVTRRRMVVLDEPRQGLVTTGAIGAASRFAHAQVRIARRRVRVPRILPSCEELAVAFGAARRGMNFGSRLVG